MSVSDRQSKPLSRCRKGEQLCIDAVVANAVFGDLDAMVSRRLADLGFCPGTPLAVVATGVWGYGPFAVRLGNQTQFVLRTPEAAKVMCHSVSAM